MAEHSGQDRAPRFYVVASGHPFFKMRSMGGTTWVLVDGIISLILGLLVYLQWPSRSFWTLGILVGVSMIVSGIARVMLWVAVPPHMTLDWQRCLWSRMHLLD